MTDFHFLALTPQEKTICETGNKIIESNPWE